MRKYVGKISLIAACFLAGALGSLFAQPANLGFLNGPPGVGFPIVSTVAGAVGTPAVVAGQDLTTGIYYPATGQWSLSISGVQAVSVTSSGWVFPAKSGTASTYACFTSGGLLISSASAC